MPATLYFAIGDVHGESAKLAALHDAILDRIQFEKLPARIVHLGDYVDRGPDTRGVIDRIMALEAMFAGSETIQVISLMGNHEQMMLNAYDSTLDPGTWWSQGGAEAADSYAGGKGRAGTDWRDHVPKAHINWMRRLLPIYRDFDRKLVFVHAGIEPASFPNESERTYLWTRSERFFDDTAWPAAARTRRPDRRPRPHARRLQAGAQTPPHQCRHRRLLRRSAHGRDPEGRRRAAVHRGALETPIQRIDQLRPAIICQQVRPLLVHDVRPRQPRRRIAERA